MDIFMHIYFISIICLAILFNMTTYSISLKHKENHGI